MWPPALAGGAAEVRAGRAGRLGIALPRAAGRAGRLGIALRGFAPAGALVSSMPAIIRHVYSNMMVRRPQANLQGRTMIRQEHVECV